MEKAPKEKIVKGATTVKQLKTEIIELNKIRSEVERIMSSFSNINKILYYWIERLEKEELNAGAKGDK